MTFDNGVYLRMINGNPWGVWFGRSDEIVEDPPTDNMHWYWGPDTNVAIQYRTSQSMLYFDPPIRRLSSSYSSQLHDGLGLTLIRSRTMPSTSASETRSTAPSRNRGVSCRGL